jgi:hypothetical protein
LSGTALPAAPACPLAKRGTASTKS